MQLDFFPKKALRCECCDSIVGYVFADSASSEHIWCWYCVEAYFRLAALLKVGNVDRCEDFIREYNSDSPNRLDAFRLCGELIRRWNDL